MEDKEKISDTSVKSEAPSPGTDPGNAFFNVRINEYRIGEKTFLLQTDFTYEELEWLDVVYERLASPQGGIPFAEKGTGQSAESNEIKGNFTRVEIEKTLKILLIPLSPPLLKGEKGEATGEFTHEDFLKTRESQSVKIIADFFLTRAVLGFFMKSFLKN